MELQFRRPIAADADVVAELYVVSWNAGLVPPMPPRALDPDQASRWAADLTAEGTRWWLAERDGEPLGFAGTTPSRDPVDPSIGELDTIAVSPSAWRQGVGRRLMAVALEDLTEHGYVQAILWTPADHPRGHEFYLATGWTPSGETRDEGRQVAFRRQVS